MLTLLRDFWQLIRRHGRLILVMAQRDLTDQFAGSHLGAVWAIAHPLLQMTVYTIVFTFLIGRTVPVEETQPRETVTAAVSVESGEAGTAEPGVPAEDGAAAEPEKRSPASLPYPVYFISGYLSWMTGLAVLNRGSNAILGNANLVKQVVFPLEVLPVKTVLASIISQLIALVAVILMGLLWAGHLPKTLLLLPVLLFFQIMAMVGLGFFLAAIAVYLRDVRELISRLAPLGMYLSPIIFRKSMLDRHPWSVYVIQLNPFSYFIWAYRDLIFYGEIRHPGAWVVVIVGSPIVFLVGYATFRRLKSQFANAI